MERPGGAAIPDVLREILPRLWPPSEFVRQLVHTLGTRVLLLPLGVVVSALLARALGPGGRGELAAAAAFAATCMQLANLGLHTSNTYYVARDRALLPVLTANTLVVSLGLGGLLAAGAAALGALSPRLLPVQGPLLVLALVWVPLGLAYMLLQNLLIGIEQVRTRNRIELLQGLAGLLLLGALIGLGRVTAASAYAASLLALVLAVAWTLARLHAQLAGPARADAALLREHLGYGLRAYFTSLCAYLMMRVDLLMVKYMRGAEEAGYYSVAVGMADLVYMIPATLGLLLFPRLSALGDPRLQLRRAEQATLAMAALLVPLAAIAAIAAPAVIRLLFGAAFLPAAPAFALLMPGIVAYGSAFAISFLMSVGLPRAVLVIWGLLVASNVALNWVLIGRLGFVGAALSSSITYTACFAAFTLYARRLVREVPARLGT